MVKRGILVIQDASSISALVVSSLKDSLCLIILSLPILPYPLSLLILRNLLQKRCMEIQEQILILDYGSQYTQLIARRCREEGVFSRIEPFDWGVDKIEELKPVGIILSGGPSSTYDENAPQLDRRILELNVPVLGICYGMQVMLLNRLGKVGESARREYGRAVIDVMGDTRLLKGIGKEEQVWMSHRDRVIELPPGWRETAVSGSGVPAAVENAGENLYGVQFHPEVSHTLSGDKILRNFLYDICGAGGGWNLEWFIDKTVEELRAKIGTDRVISAFSGGVDSTVAATLVYRAVGDQLKLVLVDNGLLRKDEGGQVRETVGKRFGESLQIIDAGDRFLEDLRGVSDPEEKRKRIGRRFIKVFEEEAGKFKGAKRLLQGTLYPDVIESSVSRGPAAVIKTHHNVGGLPEKLGLELIEPLRDLFKDECRKVGVELGLPENVVMRHPFPGPGLAVRIIGEVTAEKVRMLQEADAIFIDELKKSGWYYKVSQALAILTPLKTVGVMGDGRTYEHLLALRSVDTRDFMTADFSPLPHDLLGMISNRITGEVEGINRVVYDITSKPPGTVEWE